MTLECLFLGAILNCGFTVELKEPVHVDGELSTARPCLDWRSYRDADELLHLWCAHYEQPSDVFEIGLHWENAAPGYTWWMNGKRLYKIHIPLEPQP